MNLNVMHSIQILALQILREVSADINTAEMFTIMADESADISNQEQVVICIRWVDRNSLMAREEFISIEPIASCTAEEIVKTLKVSYLSKNRRWLISNGSYK